MEAAFAADASGNAKSDAGESYRIFGKADWSTTPTIDLANLGSAGITTFSADTDDPSGTSVSSAGDVNGGDLPLFSGNFNQSLPSAEPGPLTFMPPPPPMPLDEEDLYAPLLDDFFSQFGEEEESLLLEE